jgi:hypothetical protein
MVDGVMVVDGVGVGFARRSRRGRWVARRSLPLPPYLPLSLSFIVPSHRAQPKRGERWVAVDLAVDLVVDLVVGYGYKIGFNLL